MNCRCKRASALLLATATLGLGVVVPPLAQASTLSALMSGTVLSSGHGVSGASVTMAAWPVDTAALAVGATVPTLTLATVITTGSGAYSLSPDLSDVPAAYREADGTVNVDVETTSGESDQSYSLPVAAAGSRSAALATTIVAKTRTVKVNFDTLAHTVTSTLARDAPVVFSSPMAPTPAAGTKTPMGGGPGSYTCGSWKKAKQYDGRKQIFMNAYAWSGGSADVVETRSSEDTMGIGVAVTGGPWSASGSMTKTATASGSSDVTHTHHVQLSNTVAYGHYTKQCSRAGQKGTFYYKHKVAPVEMDTLQDEDYTKTIDTKQSIPYTHCTTMTHGYNTKDEGNNITYSAGVVAPFINLSSNASYTKDLSTTFHASKPSYLCGSDNKWLAAKTAGIETTNPSHGCLKCEIGSDVVAVDGKRQGVTR